MLNVSVLFYRKSPPLFLFEAFSFSKDTDRVSVAVKSTARLGRLKSDGSDISAVGLLIVCISEIIRFW